MPLKPGRPAVRLHNGWPKIRQDVHYEVLDIDVGTNDLQQCADAAMRLRAEYLYFGKDYGAIAFNFTNGERVPYARWRGGERPSVRMGGRSVTWSKARPVDESYSGFRAYMELIFNYAGSYSLSKELKPVARVEDVEAGDVFIQGGFPGHAVIVVDVTRHTKTGRKAFLLAQSYMPAQDVHILRNKRDAVLSPWYVLDEGAELLTPEWTFPPGSLKRF